VTGRPTDPFANPEIRRIVKLISYQHNSPIRFVCLQIKYGVGQNGPLQPFCRP